MMKTYVCSVCGFVYDEAAGYPEGAIEPGTNWEALPDDWVCPLCGATKADFEEQHEPPTQAAVDTAAGGSDAEVPALTAGELSALCSNLSKGCEKQYLPDEADLFNALATYYESKAEPVAESAQLQTLMTAIERDLDAPYAAANTIASEHTDRGALRALVWSEKVTRIQKSLINRYESKQDALLENTNIYVCEICGFVYVGDEAPAICPVCKVPNIKLNRVERS